MLKVHPYLDLGDSSLYRTLPKIFLTRAVGSWFRARRAKISSVCPYAPF